jgi:hypothetical protein
MAEAADIARSLKSAGAPGALISAAVLAGTSHDKWGSEDLADTVRYTAAVGLVIGFIWYGLIGLYRLTRAEFLSGLD